jgi:predicted esterase
VTIPAENASTDAPTQELASAESHVAADPSDPSDPSDPTGASGFAQTGGAGSGSESPDRVSEPPAPPAVDPGPSPSAACSIVKDGEGFFSGSSAKGPYVAYVPASYRPDVPMRVVVGMHGCGDDMTNFARWGMNPFATRASQDHIGISVGGESGSNRCWKMGVDDEKVLAAVEDVARCFWVHQKKVTVAGFSSGGQLAYRVALLHADRFAGLLVENSALYAAGTDPDALLAGARRRLPIAHRARTSDSVFSIAKVTADWEKLTAAGFPLQTSTLPGGHDGSSDDWAGWLIPASAAWVAP